MSTHRHSMRERAVTNTVEATTSLTGERSTFQTLWTKDSIAKEREASRRGKSPDPLPRGHTERQ